MRFHSVIFLVCALLGAQKNRVAADWLMDAWRVEEGLPDNVVDAIAQTKDGYLWLGTQGGLARFDGVRFSPGDHPSLRIDRVRQLFVDGKDRLWIVGESGDVAFIQDGQVKSFTTADGVPRSGLSSPTEDRQGRIWFSARLEDGCFYFDGHGFVHGVSTNRGPLGPFNSLAFGERETLYGARRGEVWKLLPSEPEAVFLRFAIGSQEIPLLCQSKHGGAWLVANGNCYLESGGQWKPIAETPDVLSCHEDSSGRLWCVVRRQTKALCVTTNGAITEHVFSSRFNLNVRALFEDREGNWWWSTSSDGLRRFRSRELELVSDSTNLPPNPVLAVAPDPRQGVWALMGRGLVRIADSEKPEPTFLNHRMVFPTSLWVDPDSTVWVGGTQGDVFRVSNNRLGRFREAESTGARPMFSALFRDSQMELLIGSSQGLFRWDGNGIARAPSADPLETGQFDFRAFAQDSRGRVYAALRNGGLLRRDGNVWSRITKGLPGDDLAALHCDANDALWVGVTGHGLARLHGNDVFSFQQPSLRLPRNIFGIAEDQLGFLWLSSSEGIFRVPRNELNAVADGEAVEVAVRRFDKSDGMLSTQCTGGQQSVVARSADGKLWFATARGLYVIDPTRLRRNESPPPVAIEEVWIDDKSVWTRPLNSVKQDPASIRVEPREVRLEFHFTALSLVSPQRNQFRYQLEGWDRDWQEAGAKRVAQYTRVRPGNYRFKVVAANNDGVWNETGAMLAVVVLPPWWQTVWFRTLTALSVVLIVVGAYRMRVRRLESDRLAQQEFSRRLIESQELERQRIAAELHDSLGQSLLVIKSRALVALREENLPAPVTAQLDELTTMAADAIQEVREIAHNLRPFQLDELGLTRAVRGMLNHITRAAALNLEHDLANVDGAFALAEEINFYRIVQELLNNVVKHAKASGVRVTLKRDANAVRLTVTDNGRGFDTSRLQGGGFGLRGIAERVRMLGGDWTMHSNAGKGTTVEVIVSIKPQPVSGNDPKTDEKRTT